MNYQTLTPNGTRNKRNRLICRLLTEHYPDLYAQLEAAADAQIEADNNNILLPIMDRATDVPRHPSPTLLAAVQRRRSAIKEKL